ncbi:MAG: biotin/lipoyl-binding protein [Thermoplasmata archaeon]|nr:biotin/lipoyl-binding protein [Thermoplasmata archaeon]
MLLVDGEPVEVEVDPDLGAVELSGKRFPARILSTGPDRVELEIGGEQVVVAGWPVGASDPPAGISVSGEVVRLAIERWAAGTHEAGQPSTPRTGTEPSLANRPASGAGVPVYPPMPGKILEVRVSDGQSVREGEVLLVLEAMKMRNEIPSPAAGRIEALSVRPGDSVRIRDLLLRVVGS